MGRAWSAEERSFLMIMMSLLVLLVTMVLVTALDPHRSCLYLGESNSKHLDHMVFVATTWYFFRHRLRPARSQSRALPHPVFAFHLCHPSRPRRPSLDSVLRWAVHSIAYTWAIANY